MSQPALSFFSRLALAWRVLTDASLAARAAAPAPLDSAPARHEKIDEAESLTENSVTGALQLLSMLQQHGRLIDFLQEDVSAFSDAEIGAAARVVHQGCQKILSEHLQIEAISEKEEGSRLTLEAGFDAASYRLTGNVVGQAPFTGTLAHRGWRALEMKLPKTAKGHDFTVLAPAEVDL